MAAQEDKNTEIPENQASSSKNAEVAKDESVSAQENTASETQKPEAASETATKQNHGPRDTTKEDHEAIETLLGLNKPCTERGVYEQDKIKTGIRPFIVCFITLVIIGVGVVAWSGYQRALDQQEEDRAVALKNRELAEEEARRNRIEYADIAFLESFPPAVAISMDGKQMYARSKDGSYTELRARESSWIYNLPVKGETIFKFSFNAEGFNTLTRNVAYYDWYPSNKRGGSSLQKAFKMIALEPDTSPRISNCADLPKIMDSDPCEWTVFREIVFRERYSDAVKNVPVEETQQRAHLKQLLALHHGLETAAVGFDPKILETNQPVISPELPDATKALLKNLSEHPYNLYGSVTIETDSPDTRVFFMSEPLMTVKANGSMAQVKVQPDAPFTFSVYGQGRPIDIAQTLSVRLETNDAPAYVTEIVPHQWHCDVAAPELLATLTAPEIPAEIMSPDYRHHVCDYSIKISVKFKDIKEIEQQAVKQREIKAAAEKAVAEKNENAEPKK